MYTEGVEMGPGVNLFTAGEASKAYQAVTEVMLPEPTLAHLAWFDDHTPAVGIKYFETPPMPEGVPYDPSPRSSDTKADVELGVVEDKAGVGYAP